MFPLSHIEVDSARIGFTFIWEEENIHLMHDVFFSKLDTQIQMGKFCTLKPIDNEKETLKYFMRFDIVAGKAFAGSQIIVSQQG